MVSKTTVEYSPSNSMEDYMTEDEMEDYLENLRTRIPSFIVELLKNNLKNRRLTKKQLDKIVDRITELYLSKRPEDKKTEELVAKISDLSNKLDALMRVAAISSATKFSETVDDELNNSENKSDKDETEKTNKIEYKKENDVKTEILEPSKDTIENYQKRNSNIKVIKASDIKEQGQETNEKEETYNNEQTYQYSKNSPNVDVSSSKLEISSKEESLRNEESSVKVDIKSNMEKSADNRNNQKIPSSVPASTNNLDTNTNINCTNLSKGVSTVEEVIDMPDNLTDMQKKYKLEAIPEDTISTMLVFKWLEFLVSRVGPNNLIDILDYYHSLGWISDNVVNRLAKASKNMKYFNEEFRKSVGKMIPEDHVVSLLYIEKLAGRPIPMDELENINREVARIIKWGEEIQSI